MLYLMVDVASENELPERFDAPAVEVKHPFHEITR
jgi:hypothetical protein